MSQEARERSRGDDPAVPIVDLHDTIAHQSRFGELRRLQTLACHRLDRITPDRCHRHHWSAAHPRHLRRQFEVAAIELIGVVVFHHRATSAMKPSS